MLYKGDYLREISFPLGGIGTGSIGLSGNGHLIDWDIFNRPRKGSINPYNHFVVKAEYPDGKVVAKVLQGDWTKDLSGQYDARFGHGVKAETMAGYPHFKKLKFDGTFPIATLTFKDPDFPAKVILKAFNPFIPLDADNSSIPAAFFDISIKSKKPGIKYTVLFSMRNPFNRTINEKLESDKYTAIIMRNRDADPGDVTYGDVTIAVDTPDGIYQEYWYRGGWRDPITTFWNELISNTLENRNYPNPGNNNDSCTVGASAVINPKQNKHFRFVLSWNLPNNYNFWDPYKDENGKDVTWKNYYAVLFEDSKASCFYSLDNWDMLYKKTAKFCKSLHSSTLDKSVIDAVSSTLSVLKTATVMRLEDGTLYGWEGLHEASGSCEGTCTHVWSYAYALCYLFPELEQSLRNVELHYDTDENGKMQFRARLPLGRERFQFHACLDGQMATLIKVYRDWKISGDTQWLKDNWEYLKSVLEYAWHPENEDEWDKDKDGVLEGRQHHTLDMELFGPSSWLQGMYLAALKAASEMADFLGDTEKAKEYLDIFEKGYQWTKENLFNGSYFIQKIDLTAKSYTEHFNCPNYWNDEKQQLKYQIGEGSSIDQLLGQWHSNLCGLGDIFDKEQRQTALQSMMANNYKPSMRDVANKWRVFVLNDEGGSIMCDYPEGSHEPIIPIPYCTECMTGFEYAFAGLLISEGYISEGLNVVRAVRDRYDGKKRNPWNEIECGSNYARAMASFSLLPIFSGFTYDLPHKHIGFAPLLPGDFKCFFSVGTGWGDYVQTNKECRIVLAEGSLTLNTFSLGCASAVQKVYVDGKEIGFTLDGNQILFQEVKIIKELRLVLK